MAVKKQEFQAQDIKSILPKKSSPEISRVIKKLREKKMIKPLKEGGRTYHMSFFNNFLLRGVTRKLMENGFVAVNETNTI